MCRVKCARSSQQQEQVRAAAKASDGNQFIVFERRRQTSPAGALGPRQREVWNRIKRWAEALHVGLCHKNRFVVISN